MNTKHTPGPWLFDDNEGFGQLTIWAGSAPSGHSSTPGKVIARIDESQTECEANARLIASAPELLEACKNALDILTTDRQAFVDCNQLRDCRTDDPIAHGLVLVQEDAWITPEDAEALRDYDRAIEQLTTAIAKATGSAT